MILIQPTESFPPLIFQFLLRSLVDSCSVFIFYFGLFKTEFSYSFQSAAKIGDLNPPLYVRGIKFSVILIITSVDH